MAPTMYLSNSVYCFLGYFLGVLLAFNKIKSIDTLNNTSKKHKLLVYISFILISLICLILIVIVSGNESFLEEHNIYPLLIT